MKKSGSARKVLGNTDEPEPKYIVADVYDRVFIGLKYGEPAYSEDISLAKPLEGQRKFNTLQRHSYHKLVQIFI